MGNPSYTGEVGNQPPGAGALPLANRRPRSPDTAASQARKRRNIEYAKVLSPEELQIRIYAMIMKSAATKQDYGPDEFVKSSTFGQINKKIQLAMLDPYISAYRENSTRRFVNYIRDHPERFHIKKDDVDSGVLAGSEFQTAVSGVLTQVRAEIKRKIGSSTEANCETRDIEALAYDIVPQGYMLEILYHLEGRHRNSLTYWQYIDTKLLQLSDRYKDQEKATTEAKINKRMQKLLKQDRSDYPPPARKNEKRKGRIQVASSNAVVPIWQREASNNVINMDSGPVRINEPGAVEEDGEQVAAVGGEGRQQVAIGGEGEQGVNDED